MNGEEHRDTILRLYGIERFPIGTIARELGIHHSTVERVIENAAAMRTTRGGRPSEIERFLPFIKEILERHPDITSSRFFQMMKKRGYKGGPDHFRHQLAKLRPRRQYEPFLRLESLPGEEGQVDWGHFGKVRIGQATRPLYAFVMVLSYSRAIHLRFFLDMRMASFLRGHQTAFSFFRGVPRCLLYDNLKSVVLKRVGQNVLFNPEILRFSAEWLYEARPVGVRRGNEKGRVERAIRFVRTSFWPARRFTALDQLNREAEEWCREAAMDRAWPGGYTMKVRDALNKERQSLAPLSGDLSPAEEVVTAKVAKWPFIRFDGNDYSVPHRLVRQSVTVRATDDRVRILDGQEVVAIHRRSFDRQQQIEDPEHHKALRNYKKRARERTGGNRLTASVSNGSLLLEALALRGDNIGSAVAQLLRLLDHHGAPALEAAVKEALEHGSPHPQSVRHILERNDAQQGRRPKIAVRIPDRPDIQDLSVEMSDLEEFDRLMEDTEEDEAS